MKIKKSDITNDGCAMLCSHITVYFNDFLEIMDIISIQCRVCKEEFFFIMD